MPRRFFATDVDTLENVLTVEDAAALACVSIETIKYRIDQGHLVARKLGGERRGMWIIEKSSLLAIYPQNLPASGVQKFLKKR